MSGARATTHLAGGELIRAFGVRCHAERSPFASTENARATEIVLPRRGIFVYEVQGDQVVADVATVIVIAPGDEYRVGHPVDGGDECVVLTAVPTVLEEVFATSRGRHGLRSPATQLALHHLASLGRMAVDPLQADEVGLELLERIARDISRGGTNSEPRMTDVARRQARSVKELLASDPTSAWPIGSLAGEVGCSPYHLARLFRRATGTSIHQYLLRLRLAIALGRLAQGETDLGRLAADLGFAHHSHFSASFRRIFGLTPTQARRSLTVSEWAEMSTFLTAGGRHAA